jgi:hypothetical protein
VPRRNVNDHATAESRRKGAEAAAETKRRKRDEQRALLAETRLEQLDAALERLAPAAEAAAVTIALLLKAESEAVRLRAAIATLEILEAPSLRELFRRLETLVDLADQAQPGDSEWLTNAEFDEYAELRRCGLPIEAANCQRLLAVARARRARAEPRPNNLWRVIFEQGRVAEGEEELRRRRSFRARRGMMNRPQP